MMTRATRALFALVMVAVVTCTGFAAATPAQAAPALPAAVGDCIEPPVPEDPYANGPLSLVLPTPKVLAPEGNPFAADSTTTIYEQYGSAGASFVTYDTGCTVGSDTLPKFNTFFANFGTLGPRVLVGIAATIGNTTLNPSWMSALDTPVNTVADSLRSSIAKPFGPVVLIIAAVVLFLSARKAKWGAAFMMLFMAFVGVALIALTLSGPAKITSAVDGLVAGGVASAVGGDGASSAAAVEAPGTHILADMYTVVVYQRWCEGTLGSATSDTAKTYCPRLFAAHAMTWRESQQAHTSTDAMTKMVDSKKEDWRSVADEVKTADPAAYQFLTGNIGEARWSAAFTAWIVVLAVLPFIIVAFGMVLGAYLIFRFLIGYSPVLGTLIILPAFHGLGRTLLSVVGACVLNTIVFAAGAGAIIAVSNALLLSDLPQFVALLVVAFMSLVAWLLLRPFRTLTRMATNPGGAFLDVLEAPQNNINSVKKVAGRLAGNALGSFVGNRLADKAHDRDEEREEDDTPERPETREYVRFDEDTRVDTYADYRDDSANPATPLSATPFRDPHRSSDAYTLPVGSVPEPEPAPVLALSAAAAGEPPAPVMEGGGAYPREANSIWLHGPGGPSPSADLSSPPEPITEETQYVPRAGGDGTMYNPHQTPNGTVVWSPASGLDEVDMQTRDGQEVFVTYDPVAKATGRSDHSQAAASIATPAGPDLTGPDFGDMEIE